MKTAINSGSNDYDLISPRLIDSSAFMQSGYFKNLLEVPNIDLTKPWYDQQGVAAMSINNKLYLVLSDILLTHNDATVMTIFNKQILEDYGIENPYTLVKNGKWTVDKLYDMAKAVSTDLDGDGMMTPDADQYGYLIWNDAIVSYLHSGGQTLIGKDTDDIPMMTLNSDKSFAILNKAFELLYDEFVTANIQKPAFSAYTGDIAFTTLFTSSRAAFSWCRMYMIPMLRAMETDFGIVPTPKIYEADETYWSTLNVHIACGLAIPATATNEMINRTTILMEALGAESKYTVQPAYYDISLKTKNTRDDQSAEMLDLIFNHRVIDLGDIYDFAGFGGAFYNLARNNDTNVASFCEKYETKVNTAIEKVVKKFEELD